MDDDAARRITNRRRACAAVWFVALAMGLLGRFVVDPTFMMAGWLLAICMLLVTAICKIGGDERITMPKPYRWTAIALLLVSLEGVALGIVPGASGHSQAMAVFFGAMALLAYRAAVARGPKMAVVAILIGLWSWIPIWVISLMGCRCGPARYIPIHWTQRASIVCLQVTLALLVLLVGVALLAFRPRTDALPDARLL